MPFVGRTYAPKSVTPILKSPLSRSHFSVMSGISQDGALYVQIQEKSFNGASIVGFLRHLLCHVKGKILLIWDGCPIHRSKEVKKFLSQENHGRIHIERLPAYSPELNPDEGVWQYLKCTLLKNVCCQNMKILGQKLRKAIRLLRRRKEVICSFFDKVGYV